MFTFPSTRWQEQQPSGPFPVGESPLSTALDLLSKESPSLLAPGMRCKSMDIAQSLDICETRIAFTQGEIVLTQTSTVVGFSVTFRAVGERKK
jgi:hypothetical protein